MEIKSTYWDIKENCTHENIFAFKQINKEIGFFHAKYIHDRCVDCNIEVDLNGTDMEIEPSGRTAIGTYAKVTRWHDGIERFHDKKVVE